jgi:phosphatidylglycerophosphatase A
MRISTLIATFFYSGYLKPASGTWGTLASLPLCLAVTYQFGLWGIVIAALLLFTIGLWAAHQYEIETGEHDSSRIVIDEAAGMMIACIPLTLSFDWITIVVCFALFRLFDAVKKGPVGWLDKNINGALGVMIDDIAAGLMASIVALIWFSF